MHKGELVRRLNKRTRLPVSTCERVVEAFFESIAEGLVKDGKVILRDFGTFKVSHYKAGPIRDPRTGNQVPMPSRIYPRFKAGKDLKHIVNSRPAVNG